MLVQENILFIDRDGTLIAEPYDQQVDCLSKLQFMPNVFPALLQLAQHGYRFIMVSNQDGLGTTSFPQIRFRQVQEFMLNVFASQGIHFDAIHICPHFAADGCACRKPKTGLLTQYLLEQKINRQQSYVIGDRDTDMQLASNLGIRGIKIAQEPFTSWLSIANEIIHAGGRATVQRKTNETNITADVDLNVTTPVDIKTKIRFFDHMLEQFAKHAGISLVVHAQGDLDVDEHHTIEDTAITLGLALKKALGKKLGIARYGFVLPMDEALATTTIDLSGRPHLEFNACLNREKVGDMPTELVKHFFQSLSQHSQSTIHIEAKGENCHHIIEAIFKSFGRAFRQAIKSIDAELPSTKGVL